MKKIVMVVSTVLLSLLTRADGVFKVGDATYATMAEAFAAALPNSGTIELQADASFDSRITPAAADCAGKTVTVKSASGRQYRLTMTTADAGFVFAEESTAFTLRFQDVILDGGAVWSSATLTDLTNTGVARSADFIQIGKNNNVYFDSGVIVENFQNKNGNKNYWVLQGTAWFSYFYATAGDFVARNIRGGGFFSMGQNRVTHFCGTVTNCYATAAALIYHPGNYAGSATYYDGTRICSNVVATGTYAMKLDPNWPDNVLKFGTSTDASTFVYIYDNFEADGTTRADINLCKANALKQFAPFASGSQIGIAYPTSSPEGIQIGICSYTGSTDKNQTALVYDYNPVDDVTYVGYGGDNIVWTDKGSLEREEQDPVFAVSTDGGATWQPTLYPYLEEAVAAATGLTNVIELTADAFFDTSVHFSATNTTLRSRGTRRTLRRSKAATLSIDYANLAASDTRTLVITNLIVDGGAVWSDSDDFSSRTMEKGSMKTPTDLFAVSGSDPSWKVTLRGVLELCAGALVRNAYVNEAVVAYNNTGNSSGILRMHEGVVITDCRGASDKAAAIYMSNNGGEAYVEGGLITRCGFCAVIHRVGITHGVSIGSPVITNNLVTSGALFQKSTTFSLAETVRYVFTGGTPVIRDNFDLSGKPNNVYFGATPVFTGSLTDGADLRFGFVSTNTSGSLDRKYGRAQTLGETNGLVRVDGFAGAAYIRHQDVTNGFWRAMPSVDGATTNLVWAQTVVPGETVVLEEPFAASGTLYVGKVAGGLDPSVAYEVISAPQGITGTFDKLVLDAAFGLNSRHAARWTLKYKSTKILLVYRSGLTVSVK